MSLFKKTLISLFYCFAVISLFSCEGMPGADARKYPPNPDERVKKNLEEGRGFRLDNLIRGENKGGDFMFASANELWRASLDTIDFMPLTSVNYSGGIIITDWYSDNNSAKESIKISLRFLGNEVRSESLKVIVHQKTCSTNINCKVALLSNTKIKEELHSTILRKAALLEKQSKEKKKK